MSGGAPRRERVEQLTYSPAGDLTERVVYSGDAVAARLTYRYDAKGVRHITSTSRDGVGLGLPATRLRPRENPNAAPVQNPDGTYAFSATAGYTATGRLAEEMVFAGDDPSKGSKLVRNVYKFTAGILPSEMFVFSGAPERTVTRETYTYTPDGRASEVIAYGPSNVLAVRTTYAYEIDSHGNWTKRTETTTLAGAPVVTVRYRTITYDDRPALAPK